MVGWVELDLWEHDGQAITVRHAEVLTADGALYTDSLRSAAATDGYTFAGPVGRTKLAPTGTVHGFRYAGITGLAGADLTGLEAVAVSADLAPLAGFRCSDPTSPGCTTTSSGAPGQTC
ncbi:family 78 glycoside hydrolase catalytic domain [Tessaracoccus coleopterorum]|uniref:family 78 glycoside hydrolase catalytic domain n=1 Tax=Tessaracoccus coleopterorum TaxID=2714950 RepID=UPI001E386032|nr:family 78 glycoside hydrolase catalytic domain [Tessaracoccus coleopterorum]